MPARSARRPVPALVFLLALAILAVVVWVRVADRDSAAHQSSGSGACSTLTTLPANQVIGIAVLNGNGQSGLAEKTLAAFVQDGFLQGPFGNADPYDGIATITVGPKGAASAKLVQYYVPGAVIQSDQRPDTGATVTIGTQFKGLATTDQVKAAMLKDGVVQQAAPTPGATAPAPTPSSTCTPSK